MWQTSQVMPLVETWTLCAPGLKGLVAPVAGVARPVGPPIVAVVGGFPWQESQAPPAGANPIAWG